VEVDIDRPRPHRPTVLNLENDSDEVLRVFDVRDSYHTVLKLLRGRVSAQHRDKTQDGKSCYLPDYFMVLSETVLHPDRHRGVSRCFNSLSFVHQKPSEC
jgi:hypothetical protein